MKKPIAIYSKLHSTHQLIQDLIGEMKKNQHHITNLYKLGNKKVKDYMDDEMDIDELEYVAYELKEDVIQYEKQLEELYNQWKETHYHEELFTKLDNSIFKVGYIEIEY